MEFGNHYRSWTDTTVLGKQLIATLEASAAISYNALACIPASFHIWSQISMNWKDFFCLNKSLVQLSEVSTTDQIVLAFGCPLTIQNSTWQFELLHASWFLDSRRFLHHCLQQKLSSWQVCMLVVCTTCWHSSHSLACPTHTDDAKHELECLVLEREQEFLEVDWFTLSSAWSFSDVRLHIPCLGNMQGKVQECLVKQAISWIACEVVDLNTIASRRSSIQGLSFCCQFRMSVLVLRMAWCNLCCNHNHIRRLWRSYQ